MDLSPEQMIIIREIAKRVKNRYAFGYYDADDIESECFIAAVEALPRFDASRGSLSNFLITHINNRLRNLIRNKYRRKCSHCQHGCPKCRKLQTLNDNKRSLMEPKDIGFYEDNEREAAMSYEQDHLDKIQYEETVALINAKLPLELRADYLRMLDGTYVSQARKKNVEQAILEILGDYE